MADKQIIAATLQVDTGSSNANIKEVNKNLTDVKGNLSATGATATKTGKDIEGTGGSFGKLKGQIGQLPGPLGAAQEGIGKVNTAFKALLANPIGLVLLAIVAALALLYKAFTNTVAGGEKMEQIFAGIKAAGQALIDSLEKIGSAIKNVFTFNFKGAIADIKAVGNAAGEAFSKMAKLTERSQQLKKEQLDNDLEQAKREKDLAILREKAQDDSIPIKERIGLLKTLQKQAQENAVDDNRRAKEFADNEIAKLTLQKEGAKKNKEEITKLQIDQIKVDTENANELRRIGIQIKTAERQDAAEKKQLQDQENARAKENIQLAKQHAAERKKLLEEQAKAEKEAAKARKEGREADLKGQLEYGEQLRKQQDALDAAEAKRLFDNEQTRLQNKKKIAELNTLNDPDSIDFKIAKIDADLQLELSKLAEGDLQRQILAKKSADEIVKIRADEAEAKKQIGELETQHRIAQVSEVESVLQRLSAVVGQQTIAGKAIGIATALINTYQGASEAIKQKSTLPSPFDVIAKVANVAAVIALGLKTVKSIAAVQVPGGGGGGSVPGAPSITAPSAPLAPTASSTAVQQEFLNRQGNAANPARVYMVESDGRDTAERISRLNRAARLGG